MSRRIGCVVSRRKLAVDSLLVHTPAVLSALLSSKSVQHRRHTNPETSVTGLRKRARGVGGDFPVTRKAQSERREAFAGHSHTLEPTTTEEPIHQRDHNSLYTDLPSSSPPPSSTQVCNCGIYSIAARHSFHPTIPLAPPDLGTLPACVIRSSNLATSTLGENQTDAARSLLRTEDTWITLLEAPASIN